MGKPGFLCRKKNHQLPTGGLRRNKRLRQRLSGQAWYEHHCLGRTILRKRPLPIKSDPRRSLNRQWIATSWDSHYVRKLVYRLAWACQAGGGRNSGPVRCKAIRRKGFSCNCLCFNCLRTYAGRMS